MARTTRLVGRHRGMHARRRLIALSSTIVMLAATLSTAPPASAVTLVVDPDVNSAAVTGWGWHTNATPAQINAFVGLGNRIVDLEVNSTAPTFSVAYVANAGTYARTWWWYYGLTAAQVSSQLTAHAARPIDVEPYVTSSGLRFAVVMVANTGAAQKGWWWYYGQTSTQIASFLSTHNARIVDLDRYATSVGDRFDVVYIPNTGVDASAWWYYYGQTPTQVNAHLSANHARLISLERTVSGTYDIVMAASPGLTWWWYYGQTVTSLGNLASQKGARIARIEPYVIGSTRYFAAVLINDVNAETSRIRNLVSSKMAGSWGFFVKKVNGGEIVGLQPDRIFEPASMIKIVHAVTALRQVQANTGTTLSTPITWYANPAEPARYPSNPNYANPDGTLNDPADKDVCAYDNSGNLLTGATYVDPLSTIIGQMLGWSDNRTTDALTRRYGFSGLNATATLAGMTRTHVYHRPGCPAASSPQPWHHNELTLRDSGRIYEGVERLVLLDAARRANLYSYLNGGTISSTGALATMIKAEAAAAGLTGTEINSFLANTVFRSKAGGYDLCPDSGPCNPQIVTDRTVGGIAWFPFKNGSGTIVKTPYVFGRFFNVQVNCVFADIKANTCPAYTSESAGDATVSVEMFRQVVKAALATW